METRILNDLVLSKGLVMADNLVDFPENPRIGTFVIKDQCLFGYIKIGGMETWYPFASKTNSYVHVQGLAAEEWTINHNLGTSDVWVQTKDSNGNIVQAFTDIVNNNTIIVRFTTSITGTAVVVAPDSIDVPQIKATSLDVSNGDVIIDSSGVRVHGSYVLTDANISAVAEQAAIDAIGASTTDNLSEGLSNLYFSQARARAALSGGTGVVVNQTTGQISIGQSVGVSSTPQFEGLESNGHILPVGSNIHDLGNSNSEFRHLYLGGSIFYVGGGNIKFDQTSNSFSFNSSLGGNSSFIQSSSTYTALTSAPNQVADTTLITSARTIKYIIQANEGTSYQSSEIMAVHSNTQVYFTEYAVIDTGVTISAFSVDIFDGNVRLLVSPVKTNTIFKIIKTIIN